MAATTGSIQFQLMRRGLLRRCRQRLSTAVSLVAVVATGTLLAACGTTAASSGGGPSPSATLRGSLDASSLAVGTTGDLLISQFRNAVVRRNATGTMQVVAGTGLPGYSGDGGPATQAQLNEPEGLAVGADGTVYFADAQNNRVRSISSQGTITTIAGNGTNGSVGIGGPATSAELADPRDVAVASDGSVYVSVNEAVDLISHGTLSVAVPGGPRSLGVTGTSAAKDSNNCGPTCSMFPGAIALDKAGDLFVADTSPKVLVEYSPQHKVVNAWTAYDVALAAAPDGSVVAADYGNYSIDRISDGTVTPIVTFKMGTPFKGMVFRPSAVAVAANGDIYVSDGAHLLLVTASSTIKVLGS
jgi:hypothetical protein